MIFASPTTAGRATNDLAKGCSNRRRTGGGHGDDDGWNGGLGMLRLGAKNGEPVTIVLPDGRTGKVTFMRDRFGKPSLGFEFPEDVGIYRRDVWERIQGEDDQ